MIKKLTDDEINALVEDIYRDRVFTSNHLRPEDLEMLPSIFMPLAFADEKLKEELLIDAPGMIYEHLSQAGHRSINNYPIFFSLHIVNQEDTKKILEKVEQIKKSVCRVLGQPGPG